MNAASVTDASARPADWVDRFLAALPLASIFVWALFAYAWLAWLMKSPIIFSDELEIAALSRSIAVTGHPALRNVPYWNTSLVPFFFAPAWLFHDTRTAYQVAKFIGVLFMTATVFPTYALARLVVGRPAALFAAAGSVAIPAFMYSSLMLEEPFGYFFGAVGLWLIVRALALRTRSAYVLAAAASVLGPLVRQELAMLPIVYGLAAIALSWQSGRVARWRAGWSRGTLLRGAVLLLGVLILLNEEMSHQSHTWQLATRHYKGDVFRLGAWAGGAFTIGVGVVPVLIALALLVRAPGEPRSPGLSAFRATLAAALVAFLSYASVKAAYLAATFATRAVERNVFYLAPLVFTAMAIWLERPRLNRWGLAAAAVLLGVVLWVVPVQLDWPYFEAPGFSLLALFNRDLYVAPSTLARLKLPLEAIALALVLLPLALGRLRGARAAVTAAVAVLVIAWCGAGAWAGSAGERSAADALMANFPDPPNWIDRDTHGDVALFLGQNITDANGIWLNEFWNRSLRYVWSLDGSAPGPGATVTPNILDADGLIPQRGEVRYVLAMNGIDVVGKDVDAPLFGVVGRPLRLFRIDYPVRLKSTVTGLYPDGWSGAGPVAYDGFRTRARKMVVTASRVGGNGPGTSVAVTLGRMKIVLGQPTLAPPLVHRTCSFGPGGSCSVTLRPPDGPFRIEVKPASTFSPHDVDPRISDARQLGVHVGFTASRR